RGRYVRGDLPLRAKRGLQDRRGILLLWRRRWLSARRRVLALHLERQQQQRQRPSPLGLVHGAAHPSALLGARGSRVPVPRRALPPAAAGALRAASPEAP